MRKAIILATIMCLASLANAKPEQRILVLGEGQIKNLSVNFGEGYCADAGSSPYQTSPSEGVLPIEGGFQCIEGKNCWYKAGFWFELKMNGKVYQRRNYTTSSESFDGIIYNYQCRQRSLKRFDVVSANMLDELSKIDSGHIIVDSINTKSNETQSILKCYKKEIAITFDVDTNVINTMEFRLKNVKCP